jgi:cytochrome b561
MERHTMSAPRQPDYEQRRTRTAMATTTVLWIAIFMSAVVIAATVGESTQRAQIEAQIRATHAQNAALQKDIQKTQEQLNVARSPAEIRLEAQRWGYR